MFSHSSSDQRGLEAGLASGSAAAVRRYVEQYRRQLESMLSRPASSGIELARQHAAAADHLLDALFRSAQLRAAPVPDVPLLLAAVGGYGREQLGLGSDLDVRFFTSAAPEQIEPLIDAMLYPLWDAGVPIGHQVISVDDAIGSAFADLPMATAILDCRPLAGDLELADQLRERAYAELFTRERVAEFSEQLQAEVDSRHRRLHDSVYLLEPDVKSGVGGLRDVDVAWWLARARFGAADWHSLIALGALTPHELQATRDAVNFLWSVRNHLHHAAARKNDRLTFDQQEQLAERLGYLTPLSAAASDHKADHDDEADEQQQLVAVEAFMSDFYRHASAVTRLRERMFTRCNEPQRSAEVERTLGNGIRSVAGQLTFAEFDPLGSDSTQALRIYRFALAVDRSVHATVRDRITHALADDPRFAASLRASPEAATLFVGLLCTVAAAPFRHGSILGELHDVGLLLAMIPEFAPVVGRVHHDLYHVYTVDVHSVAAVDRLRALMRGDLLAAQPLASRLAAEVTQPEILFFATLLHDIGKVSGGREHSERGAAMATAILARFGFAQEESERVSRLILHHLTMYFVAARRDLSDAATIADFAKQVGDRATLRDLYLLTVVDISTTAPTSMTTWKARMLEELYLATDAALSGEGATDLALLSRIRGQVEQTWPDTLDAAFLTDFLSSMPDRYLLSNTPTEISAHAQVALAARSDPFHLRLVPSRHPDVAELCVVTGSLLTASSGGAALCVIVGDRPGLLAAIAAAVTASRLEIHAAQIYSRLDAKSGPQAVDVFWVRDRTEGTAAVARALPKLERDLQNLISGKITPQELFQERAPSRWSERPSPPVPNEVSIDNRSSRRHTIIEVIARDRPGLLFSLSHALYELRLSIAVAKVNTEGNRVVDVFYVTELDDSKLTSKERCDEVRAALLLTLRAGR